MKRRKVTARKHARKHNRTAKRSRAINSTSFILRGGIRL